jgi:hypothetical protein
MKIIKLIGNWEARFHPEKPSFMFCLNRKINHVESIFFNSTKFKEEFDLATRFSFWFLTIARVKHVDNEFPETPERMNHYRRFFTA